MTIYGGDEMQAILLNLMELYLFKPQERSIHSAQSDPTMLSKSLNCVSVGAFFEGLDFTHTTKKAY